MASGKCGERMLNVLFLKATHPPNDANSFLALVLNESHVNFSVLTIKECLFSCF